MYSITNYYTYRIENLIKSSYICLVVTFKNQYIDSFTCFYSQNTKYMTLLWNISAGLENYTRYLPVRARGLNAQIRSRYKRGRQEEWMKDGTSCHSQVLEMRECPEISIKMLYSVSSH